MRSTPNPCFSSLYRPPSPTSIPLSPSPSLPFLLPSTRPLILTMIQSSPGFKSRIKKHLLYASYKEPLISIVEEKHGLPITKKVSALSVHKYRGSSGSLQIINLYSTRIQFKLNSFTPNYLFVFHRCKIQTEFIHSSIVVYV